MWVAIAAVAGGVGTLNLVAAVVASCRDKPSSRRLIWLATAAAVASVITLGVVLTSAAAAAQPLVDGAKPMAGLYRKCGCIPQAIEVAAESFMNNPLPLSVQSMVTVILAVMAVPIATFALAVAFGRATLLVGPLTAPAAAAAGLAVGLYAVSDEEVPTSLRFLVNGDRSGYVPPSGCGCEAVQRWTDGGILKPYWREATADAFSAFVAATATAVAVTATSVAVAIAPRGISGQ